MIILDTSVVSEAMKPIPDDAVRSWLDEQAVETLFLTSVTVAELMFGIGALPAGKRREKLSAALDGLMTPIPAASKALVSRVATS